MEGSKSEQSSALDDCQHADNGVFQDEERVAMEADAILEREAPVPAEACKDLKDV